MQNTRVSNFPQALIRNVAPDFLEAENREKATFSVFIKESGASCFKFRNWYRACNSYRFSQCFDTLDFMKCRGRKIRLPTIRTRAHGDGFNEQQFRAFTKTARNMLGLNGRAAAMGTESFIGRHRR